MATIHDVTEGGAGLQAYVLMAKSARGAGAAKLVQKAIDDPAVFVFGELLDCPSIQEVCENVKRGKRGVFSLESSLCSVLAIDLFTHTHTPLFNPHSRWA